MKPRIAATVGTAHHGGADPLTLAPEAVQRATQRFAGFVKALHGVDAATVEAARLRNAFHQQCHL